jgi:AcrR family transcriptional regulator
MAMPAGTGPGFSRIGHRSFQKSSTVARTPLTRNHLPTVLSHTGGRARIPSRAAGRSRPHRPCEAGDYNDLMSQTSAEMEAVLDAAAACYLRFGVDKTTAVDIARAAGISRATLYRKYGSHEAIFLALLTRESEDMMRDAERHLAQITDPGERVVEGMLFAIGEIGRRPVHAAVFTTESAGWAATEALRVDALRRLGEAGIRPLLATAGTSIPEQAVDDLVDWMLRILISYAAVPGPAELEPSDIRRHLTTLFLPALGRLVAPDPVTPGRQGSGPRRRSPRSRSPR